ncbi:MAG: radical SAM protein [Anaerolineae bacterium]|nr:radical SAM protein [Anaerolineae bacterium]NIN99650.1 radical SAM protein [Anaerolineae bacterium]NIQ82502.1 radical SAM protein [Anaerolineae bacterium]
MTRGECQLCGGSFLVSHNLASCVDCIRDQPEELMPHIRQVQAVSRREFGLPEEPPRDPEGVACRLCVNECRIGEGRRGFCGLRTNRNGKLVHLAGTAAKGILRWYHDPLPTNCVAAWVCEGSKKYGYNNLAVFYGACTFNCLFCQNWHYREMSPNKRGMTARELADKADRRTFCVCYFGGDPSAQMLHALATSEILAEQGVRVCWETNGSVHPRLLRRAVELALETGGCVKFDLKAYDEHLHRVLTGATNRRTLENFARAGEYVPARQEPPLLVASTLLVPGYVDAREVAQLAKFIVSLDPNIPYSLLGFHPHFFMPDLPRTSVRHAEECELAAKEAGLVNVRIGNRHLLSRDY